MAKKYKYSEFGSHLKQNIREKYGDLRLFSKVTGLSEKQLYDYESGRTFPPIDKFLKICEHLNRTTTYMLSPLLHLTPDEKDLVYMYEQCKEMLKDEKVAPTLKIMITAFEILFKMRRSIGDNNELVQSLENISKVLFIDQKVKTLNSS